MARPLTPRGKALRWMTKHRGLREQPPGSNKDNRKDGIRAAQVRCANGGTWLVGQPWCGVWTFNASRFAGVKNLNARMASVAFIEDDARAKRGCYSGWSGDPRKALRGDLVVLFGRGVHVELVREVNEKRRYLVCDGGNTSSGAGGSQSNGGGSYRRVRPFSAVHGIAHIDFPGS